ncbi:MAG: nucleotide sugar dehydratase [Rhodospirillaceae bacterium]|nr:nucleotide sugar dehydratase [Rhodospirillaceae bacterium]
MNIHRTKRLFFSYLHDVTMAGVSFILSLYLRLGSDLLTWSKGSIYIGLTIFVLVAALVFLFMRLDRIIWRYVSLGDLGRILQSVILTIVIFVACQFVYNRLDDFPRSFLLIEIFVLTAMISAPRFFYRFLKDGELSAFLEKSAHQRTHVLLVGAGNESDLFIREMTRGKEAPYRVVGIIDELGGRIGRNIRGVPVFGNIESMGSTLEKLNRDGRSPQRVVITNPQLDGKTVRKISEACEKAGLSVSRMPRVTDLGNMNAQKTDLTVRPIDVEDVLGRRQTILDPSPVSKLISGNRVLITGSGGTIGSELACQVANFNPQEIILFDNSEFLLYKIDLALHELYPKIKRCAVLGDVQNKQDVDHLLSKFTPDVIVHSAALKHVPVAENNLIAAVRTNVLGTRNVAMASIKNNAKVMVLISTDKAVNPFNVMGATKRLAELICLSLDKEQNGCKFVIVRFGNVLGSTGSVIPLFERQIAAGGPLTVTHREMTRFFMTVKEAASLVLQAAAMSRNKENTDKAGVHVLEMGEPIRIVDLARQLIRLSGLSPDKDIKIQFTGIRKGEKLHEELFSESETLMDTEIQGIKFVSSTIGSLASMQKTLRELEEAVLQQDERAVTNLLQKLVPELVLESSR